MVIEKQSINAELVSISEAEAEYTYWSKELERLGFLYITARKNFQQAKVNCRKINKK